MAKFQLRINARAMRASGESVKRIAEQLCVSKSTASIWVRDIILSIDQLENLKQTSLKGAALGRERSALLQKQRWLQKMGEAKEEGKIVLSSFSDREKLIAGLALYWGEGSKKSREVEFCNSDPSLVRFLLSWLETCFLVKKEEIRCCVGINEIHKHREKIVKEYWSKVTGIPLTQFRKTSFKKVKNKKVYANLDTHYGTLSVSVMNPSRFYAKILGLIDAFQYAWQGSSMAEHLIHNEAVMGPSPIPATQS